MSDNRQSLSDLKDIAAAAATDAPVPAAPVAETPVETAPLRQQELDKFVRSYATGRRKDAVARVWVKTGTGKKIGRAAGREAGCQYVEDRGGTGQIKKKK